MVKFNFTIKDLTNLREFIHKNPQETKRLLGMEHPQLIELIKAAELLDEEKRQQREERKIRLIKAGGGCPKKLSTEEQLLLTLIYLQQNPTFQICDLLRRSLEIVLCYFKLSNY